MATVFDYINWRGDLTFQQVPFNPVDNLILARISYLPFEGIVPGPDSKKSVTISEAADEFELLSRRPGSQLSSAVILKEDPRLLSVLGESKRFGSLRLARYVNNIDISEEKQFSVLTIFGGKIPPYISFRGTDLTIVGWKEDFNMSFLSAVPSQLEAVAYLEKIARVFRGPLRIGGHSKGGNLAVYASAFCNHHVQKRIMEVYNNDGPGFSNEVINKKSFQGVAERIHTFIPQSSIIGMLFEHEEKYTVVQSTQKGLMQHDLFSWQVVHNDVVRLDEITNNSKFVDKTMKDWLNSLDPEQRKELVNHLYDILTSTHANTLQELTSQWLKNTGTMIKTINNADETTRKNLSEIFSILAKAARNNINYILPDPFERFYKHRFFQQKDHGTEDEEVGLSSDE